MKKNLEIIIKTVVRNNIGQLRLDGQGTDYVDNTYYLVGMKDLDKYIIYYENKELSRGRYRKYPQLIRKGYVAKDTVDNYIEMINNLYLPQFNIKDGLVNSVSQYISTGHAFITHMEALSENSPYYDFRENHKNKSESLTTYEFKNVISDDFKQHVVKQSYSGHLYLNYRLYAFDKKYNKIVTIKADYDNDYKRYVTKGTHAGIQIPEDEIDYLNRRIRTDKYHGIKYIILQDLIVLYAQPILD